MTAPLDKVTLLTRALLLSGVALGLEIALALFVLIVVDPASSWVVTTVYGAVIACCAAWVWHNAWQLVRAISREARR